MRAHTWNKSKKTNIMAELVQPPPEAKSLPSPPTNATSSLSYLPGGGIDPDQPDLGQEHGVVNNEAAKRFASLNKFHQPPKFAAEYNGNSVSMDYRDLLTHVVDNFQSHCFATGKADIPISFTIDDHQSVKAIYNYVNGRTIQGDLIALDISILI
jgi:hypothetical protein